MGNNERAVVLTVTVKPTELLPLSVMELVDSEQLDSGTGSVQLSDTVPVNPFEDASISV